MSVGIHCVSLKPTPQNTAARFAEDIPVNEYLTMRIASKIFGINTAEHELVAFADGEYAYMTKCFDRRDGHFTSRYEELGFYSGEDFVELGECFGVPENTVRRMLARFGNAACDVVKEIASSVLSVPAKELYLKYFKDRLRVIEM